MKTVYSISSDVASQSTDAGKLDSEISSANCVSDFDGVIIQGDRINVLCSDVTNQEMLDSIIHNHVAISLSDKKAAKIVTIDERTDEIIASGFDFDGNHFSLSAEAQTNWLGLAALQAFISWPINITTGANTSYSLSLANVPAFILTGMGTIEAAVGSGRALKIAVNDAADQAALDAVVDNR